MPVRKKNIFEVHSSGLCRESLKLALVRVVNRVGACRYKHYDFHKLQDSFLCLPQNRDWLCARGSTGIAIDSDRIQEECQGSKKCPPEKEF